MSEVWAVIVVAIVLLILYGMVSSKLQARRRRKVRAKTMPFVDHNLRQGVAYNVYLSNGKKFLGAQLLGTSDPEAGHFSLDGWGVVLVLMQDTGKRAYVRQSSVRCIEEA